MCHFAIELNYVPWPLSWIIIIVSIFDSHTCKSSILFFLVQTLNGQYIYFLHKKVETKKYFMSSSLNFDCNNKVGLSSYWGDKRVKGGTRSLGLIGK